jgi:NADH dehydrogenase
VDHRVFLSGGGGFVGGQVLSALLVSGHRISALVHRASIGVSPDVPRTHIVVGDLFDAASLAQAMDGCDAAIHLVGIIRQRPRGGITFERIHVEGARRVVDAARRAGARRYIHMSALGARPDAPSAYHRTKFAAEEIVRASGLDWTIFRPSLIHGPEGQFMRMEARWARKKAAPWLFMPYFGAGLLGRGRSGRLQPIYVDDLARAFVEALENPRTIGQTYDLGGGEAVSWPQLHRLSARAIVGRRRWVMPIPAWKARILTCVLPGFLLPFNRDQVVMALEDNTCDLSKFAADFGWTPRGLSTTLGLYAERL